jgi:hypothetical protein
MIFIIMKTKDKAIFIITEYMKYTILENVIWIWRDKVLNDILARYLLSILQLE